MTRFIFTMLVLSMVNIISAQQTANPAEYNVRHYTIEDGLSNSAVNCIAQDKDGFLWFGTQEGLNRFDGTSFTVYRHDDANPNSISGNYIYSLLSCDEGIWVGTRSSGLCYFQYDKKEFTTIAEFSNKTVFNIAKYQERIFVAMGKDGLGIISQISGRGDEMIVSISDFFANRNIAIISLHVSISGRFWVGTEDGELYYADANETKPVFHKYNIPNANLRAINVINSNSEGLLLLGTDAQLYSLDLSQHHLKSFELELENEYKPVHIFDLKWENNLLWVATDAGILVYGAVKGKKKLLAKYIDEDKNPNSLTADIIYCLFFDQFDQIWTGSMDNINLLHYNPYFRIKGKGDGIFSILKHKDDLWVATLQDGLKLFRNNHYYNLTQESHQLIPKMVFSLLLDDREVLWAGTLKGISLVKNSDQPVSSMIVRNISHSPVNNLSLSNNNTRQIYQDRERNIWVCTAGGGLNLVQGDLSKDIIVFKHFKHEIHNESTISSDGVNCIQQIDTHTYLVGTNIGVDVMTYDGDSGKEAVFSRLLINGNPVLTDMAIYDFMVAKDGVVWVGTTKGLFEIDLKAQRVQSFTVKDGMPNDVVYGLEEDSLGRIWMATNNGITCFDRGSRLFSNYNVDDGLPCREFNVLAHFKDEAGKIYFGGMDGLTYFSPETLSGLDRERELLVNTIEITNQKTRKLEAITTYSGAGIELVKENFPFYVNFTDVDLRQYKNNSFAYRLRPNDDEWNYIKKERRIQFLDLSPGKYFLEIQGVSRNGVWQNTKPLVIPIVIIPSWWASSLAYSIYGALLLVLVYLIARFMERRKLEKQERHRLMELDQLKTRLYNNIAHEFKTPLTVIMGMTENMAMEMNVAERARNKEKFDDISRNSQKLLHLINQMLDLSKVESGKMQLNLIQSDIVPYLKNGFESFRSHAEMKKVSLQFYHEMDKIVMDFDPDKIAIIISNLISNGIKFTEGEGKIVFHVSRREVDGMSNLVIKVDDDGIGIAPENLKRIFERFYQADVRNMTVGTGIGLSLTKELVELMNGTIIITSEKGRGTTCVIELPITNEAERMDEITEPQLADYVVTDAMSEGRVEEVGKEELPIVLIVEDNRDVARYIASCLKGQYNVLYAQDGEVGIETAIETIPDIIITDLMMPKKDGFALCNTVKNDERTSHIPIIMLTARSLEEDKLKGYICGADAYLIKPFNRKELLIRVEQLILLRKRLQQKYQSVDFSKVENDSTESVFLNKCRDAIMASLEDEKFKAPQLAHALLLSESQLYRKLKALTDMSIAVFIRDVRLTIANEMLTTTNKTVSDVSYDCGFSNPAWFGKAFKEKYGCSPSETRK